MTHRLFAKLLCALSLLGTMLPAVTDAADVRVMISAGFYHPYAALLPTFERESGHRLVTIRGPSLGDSPEAIPNRLARGETADVVIMVGASIDDLTARHLVQAGSRVDIARSQIGMVVRAGAPRPDISSADAFRRVLQDATSIAYSDSASGIYLSTTLFDKLGVGEQTRGKSRKIKGPPSGEPVAAVVARGEAQIGFQQVSELLHVPGVDFIGPIPAELQQDTMFSAALGTSARDTDAARALIRFLTSAQAAPAIRDAGLAPFIGH